MTTTIDAPQTKSRDLIGERRIALRRALIAGWTSSPEALVPTPGESKPESSVADAVDHVLSSPGGDALRHEMLQLIIASAHGERINLRASALVATIATRYARFHAEDSLREEGLLC